MVGPTFAAACAAAVFHAAASAAQAPDTHTQAGPSPLAVITLDPYPSTTRAFTVRARVRGQKGVFLWDTGEGVSMVTPAFARRVGCTPWGQVTGYRMTGDRMDTPHCDNMVFDVSGMHLAAPSVIVYDIAALTKPDAPPLDGALGLDIFAGHALTFQLVRGTLTVESAASLAARVAPARGAVEVPVRIVRDAEGLALSVDLPVQTPAGTAWMELDSGNGGPSMFVARYLAGQFGLDTTRTVPQPVRIAIGGRTVRTCRSRQSRARCREWRWTATSASPSCGSTTSRSTSGQPARGSRPRPRSAITRMSGPQQVKMSADRHVTHGHAKHQDEYDRDWDELRLTTSNSYDTICEFCCT
jgi:hypothetical protein